MADEMRNTLHATLAHGGYRYEYEDGKGLRCTVTRETRRSGERYVWTHDMLPDQEFPKSDMALVAVEALTPDDLILEAGKYPHMGIVVADECGNACRLCPRVPFAGERIKHETWRVQVMTSWQGACHASLCNMHLAAFAGRPGELLAALRSEAAERKARGAEFLKQLRATSTPKGDTTGETP